MHFLNYSGYRDFAGEQNQQTFSGSSYHKQKVSDWDLDGTKWACSYGETTVWLLKQIISNTILGKFGRSAAIWRPEFNWLCFTSIDHQLSGTVDSELHGRNLMVTERKFLENWAFPKWITLLRLCSPSVSEGMNQSQFFQMNNAIQLKSFYWYLGEENWVQTSNNFKANCNPGILLMCEPWNA